MRISPLSSALAAAPTSKANATVTICRENFIGPVPLSVFLLSHVAWILSARPLEKVAAGVGKLGLHALHQFGNRRGVRDLADALARAPDVAPRLGFGIAAGAKIHLRLVGDRQVVGI